MIKNKYTIFRSVDFLLCPLSVLDFVNVSVMDFFTKMKLWQQRSLVHAFLVEYVLHHWKVNVKLYLRPRSHKFQN